MKSHLFRSWIHSWLKSELASFSPGRRPVAVVVYPWFMTFVPWYTITIALFLAKRGRRVTFIVDDMLFGKNPAMHRIVLNSIERALRLIDDRFEIYRLSTYALSDSTARTSTPLLPSLISHYAELNTTWLMRGESPAKQRGEYLALMERQLWESGKQIEALLEVHDYEYLFLGGGVCGSNGLWYELARLRGIRPVTFDAGTGIAIFSVDGIAAQLDDIPRAFEILKRSTEIPDWVLSRAHTELNQRQQGRDKFASQVSGSSSARVADVQGILMALNSPWDSACLGLHAVFANTREWIIETVQWVLDHSNETIIVRQHPAERFPSGKSIDNVDKLLLDTFGRHPRIRFVAADSPANTYDLLEQVHCVLVHTSTLGVEAAMMGKAVITSSDSYYANMDFVHKGTSKDHYFRLIHEQLRQGGSVGPDHTQAASYCYYLGQCCNWIWGVFNVDNYPGWAKMDVVSLYQLEEVQLILDAIDTNIPVAVLNHEKNLRSAGVPFHSQ